MIIKKVQHSSLISVFLSPPSPSLCYVSSSIFLFHSVFLFLLFPTKVQHHIDINGDKNYNWRSYLSPKVANRTAELGKDMLH